VNEAITPTLNSTSARPPLIEACRIERLADGSRLLGAVSLAVAAGDRMALLGPSGSGKTLLLRALAMLDPLQAGEIRWHGEPVAGHRIPLFRSRVIYLHQRPALLEGTVEENLRQPFSLRIHRDKQFDEARILSLLKSVGRDDSFLAKQQRDLSGGEAQLTALLRVIQLDPEVLLLDEPTAALDAEATALVESLVTGWSGRKPNRATVWVTHNQAQARRVSTRMLQIREGRLTGARE
jgi:putative ABC transport system ATP-binding protein